MTGKKKRFMNVCCCVSENQAAPATGKLRRDIMTSALRSCKMHGKARRAASRHCPNQGESMTARKTRPTTRPAAAASVARQPAPTENERQQMAVATEGAEAVRRGFEAIRQINDRAVQSALVRFTAAAEKYRTPREPLELLAIPAELMRSQIEGAATYWQELSSAALEMQAELLGCSSHLVDSDAMLQTASAMDALPAFPFYSFERMFGAGNGSMDRPGRTVLHGLDTGADSKAQGLAP
jgi:hypothetical protein